MDVKVTLLVKIPGDSGPAARLGSYPFVLPDVRFGEFGVVNLQVPPPYLSSGLPSHVRTE